MKNIEKLAEYLEKILKEEENAEKIIINTNNDFINFIINDNSFKIKLFFYSPEHQEKHFNLIKEIINKHNIKIKLNKEF